jgi:hypothetical protein
VGWGPTPTEGNVKRGYRRKQQGYPIEARKRKFSGRASLLVRHRLTSTRQPYLAHTPKNENLDAFSRGDVAAVHEKSSLFLVRRIFKDEILEMLPNLLEIRKLLQVHFNTAVGAEIRLAGEIRLEIEEYVGTPRRELSHEGKILCECRQRMRLFGANFLGLASQTLDDALGKKSRAFGLLIISMDALGRLEDGAQTGSHALQELQAPFSRKVRSLQFPAFVSQKQWHIFGTRSARDELQNVPSPRACEARQRLCILGFDP